MQGEVNVEKDYERIPCEHDIPISKSRIGEVSLMEKDYTTFICLENERIGSIGVIEEDCEIDDLWINSDVQGKGIGKIVYGHVEKELIKDGCSQITVGALDRAVSFWERMGFTTWDSWKDFNRMVKDVS